MSENKKQKGKGKTSLLVKIITGITGVLVLSIIVCVCYVLHLLSLPQRDIDGTPPSTEKAPTTSEEDTSGFEDLPTITEPSTFEQETTTEKTIEVRTEKGVYNIILLGADKPSGYLTDCMIVVTINQNDNTIKMTSFMRDTLVNIPGKGKNRLNTAYANGGAKLLYQVFRESFGIELFGYVLVDYDSLAVVVDALGGVELYVSEAIADFLNNSNYIADEASRNLIPGETQLLNGSQVVGYCRQRRVGNGHEANDFARTQRQRDVLNTIYEKFRNQSLTQLLGLMEKLLPMVLTDMDSGEMIEIATKAINGGLGDIKQFRIPISGTYRDAVYKPTEDSNGMRILDIDFEPNVEALHEFIFGASGE